MNLFTENQTGDVLGKAVEMDGVVNNFIQPFKEMPSADSESEHRLNAHELFSLYTANVIKEDIVYAR